MAQELLSQRHSTQSFDFTSFMARAFFKILVSLPYIVVRLLALVVPYFLLFFAKKTTDLIYWNIETCYQLPRHTKFARVFVVQMFRSQILGVFETLRCIAKPEKFRVDGLDQLKVTLETLDRNGQAGIFATAHLGSWEIAAQSLARCGRHQVYALGKPAKVAFFDRIIEVYRSKAGVKILWTNRASLGKSMIAVFREHNILGVVMDQKPLARQGHMVKFFGLDTEFVSGPTSLALRYKVPLFCIYALRIGPCHYRLEYRQLYDGNGHVLPDDEITLSQRCAADIEQKIRLYPEQWVWNYKRWRQYTRINPKK